MVALVDDLEGLGAVKRAKHPTDRRAYALFLTPKGKKLFEGAFEVALSLEERLCENISKSDREQLLDLLGQLNSLTDVPGGVHPGLSR
jgi:DNA-binding MarR family transcriptional regulator